MPGRFVPSRRMSPITRTWYDTVPLMRATLHYSEALVRSAVVAFWWRTVGWKFVVAFLALAGALGYLVLAGDRSWLVGALGAVLGLALALVVTIYVVHLRGSLQRFRRMTTKEASLTADSDKLVLASDVGTSELRWAAVCDVWRFERFWLLFFSRAQFVTLPVADLDGHAQEFIAERVRIHGGKVV